MRHETIFETEEVVESGVDLAPVVISFEHIGDFVLRISFENEEQVVFDVKPYLNRSAMMRELLDPAYFDKAIIHDGTIEWPNGQNFCFETFYELGIPVEQK